MEFYRIANWEDRQSIRGDTKSSTGPWIKAYKSILTNRKIARLTDAQVGQLLKLWLVAATEFETFGLIPSDPRLLRKIALLDDEPDLALFESLGLIEPVLHDGDPSTTRARPVHGLGPDRQRPVAPEERREDERREDEDPARDADGPSPSKMQARKRKADAGAVLVYLNRVTGKAYRRTTDIEACLKRGASVEDCQKVLDYLRREWGGSEKMAKHIDPTTPFRKSNFEKYLDAAGAGETKLTTERRVVADTFEPEPEITPEDREASLAFLKNMTKGIGRMPESEERDG